MLTQEQIDFLHTLMGGNAPTETGAAGGESSAGTLAGAADQARRIGAQVVRSAGEILDPVTGGRSGEIAGQISGVIQPPGDGGSIGGMLGEIAAQAAGVGAGPGVGAGAGQGGGGGPALQSTLVNPDPVKGEARIYFATGATKPDATGAAVLAQVAQLLAGATEPSVTLHAYADLQGDPGQNKQLSARRGKQVKSDLAALGVPERDISVWPIGGTDMFSKTDQAANRLVLVRWRALQPLTGGGGYGGAGPALYQKTPEGGFAKLFFDAGKIELTGSALTAINLCIQECTAPGVTLQPAAVYVHACAAPAGDTDRDPVQLARDRGDVVLDRLAHGGIDRAFIEMQAEATDVFSSSDPTRNMVVTIDWQARAPAGKGQTNGPPAGGLPAPGASGAGTADAGLPGADDPETGDDAAALPSRVMAHGGDVGHGEVYFASRSAAITSSARSVLALLASEVTAAPDTYSVVVDCYADAATEADGSWAAQRGEAVIAALGALGVPASRLTRFVAGPTRDFSPNTSAPNRLVDLSWRLLQTVPGGGGRHGAQASVYQKTKLGGVAKLYFDAGRIELTGSAKEALKLCLQDVTGPGAVVDVGSVVCAGYAATGTADTDKDPAQLAQDRADAALAVILDGGFDEKLCTTSAMATDMFSRDDPSGNMLVVMKWFGRPRLDPLDDPPPVALEQKSLIIAFPPGKTTLDAEARRLLDGLGDLSKASEGVVDGYASKDGDAQKNLEVSRQRAAAVVAYLQSRGMPPLSIRMTPHGGTDQFGADDPDANRVATLSLKLPAS